MVNSLLWGAGVVAGLGLSARWNWWRPRRSGVPVLMYHKVGRPPVGSRLGKLWVSVDQLRKQMLFLKENGFTPIHFSEWGEYLAGRRPWVTKPVVITFDDGYQNNLTEALPVLQEFQFKAVIFVVTEAIGKDNFWHDPATEARLPMLTWEEVKKLQEGGFEIGSHTLHHPRLATLPKDKARVEIMESRRVLAEKLGKPPVSFAYPYGNGADEEDLQGFVKEAGYQFAVSVHQGLAQKEDDLLCLNRLFIRGDDNMFDFYLQMTRGKSRF